jgi:hypothetical protein
MWRKRRRGGLVDDDTCGGEGKGLVDGDASGGEGSLEYGDACGGEVGGGALYMDA